MQYPFSVSPNNPKTKGALAGKRLFFGSFDRYAVAPVHTRFDAVTWFVWDAEVIDEVTENPAVIRQEDSFEAAIATLI